MIQEQDISLHHIVVQGTGNIASDMGGERVMLSIQNGKYYNLGEVGGVIWDLTKNPIPVKLLITTLMSKYEVEQSECEEQVLSFLKHLLEEKLINIQEEVCS